MPKVDFYGMARKIMDRDPYFPPIDLSESTEDELRGYVLLWLRLNPPTREELSNHRRKNHEVCNSTSN